MNNHPIIAVSGHSNSGKTTLVRTLTRKIVGTVADEVNVTIVPESVQADQVISRYEKGLFAEFVDCPGFQHAAHVRQYLDALQRSEDAGADFIKDARRFNIDLTLDIEAVKAIQTVDVVLYVATLENVPGNNHRQEMALVRELNRVVGVVNKERLTPAHLGKERIGKWQRAMSDAGFDAAVPFDAYWATTAETRALYDGILGCLPDTRVKVFHDSLNEFWDHQEQIRDKAAGHIAKCIASCRVVLHGESGESETLQREVKETIEIATGEFFGEIEELYVLESVPGVSREELEFAVSEGRGSALQTLSAAAGGATVGTAAGYGIVLAAEKIGEIVGGIVGGSLGATAGTAAGPGGTVLGGATGAAKGAAAGGAIGGGLGAAALGLVGWLKSRSQDLQLSDETLRDLAVHCLSVTWCMSRHCLGMGRQIGIERVESARDRVRQALSKSAIDWRTADEVSLRGACLEVLSTELEG